MPTEDFPSIDSAALDAITGGATTTSSSNAQLTATLQSITSSLSSLANQNNQSSLSQLLPILGQPLHPLPVREARRAWIARVLSSTSHRSHAGHDRLGYRVTGSTTLRVRLQRAQRGRPA
jgi:hypothetical protein